MSEQKAKRVNRQHTESYKKEALALSERIGVAKAARQLGLAESLIYTWRKKYVAINDETSMDLAQENQRLKRLLAQKEEELAIVKKAATYLCP